VWGALTYAHNPFADQSVGDANPVATKGHAGPKRNGVCCHIFKGQRASKRQAELGRVTTMTTSDIHDAPDTVEVHGEKSETSKLSIFIGILKRYYHKLWTR
jgi:hypothetical protein